MRMTSRVKPPTAAVTMTRTWPWSEAMSDAEGGAEESLEKQKWRVNIRDRMIKIKKREEGGEGKWEKEGKFSS